MTLSHEHHDPTMLTPCRYHMAPCPYYANTMPLSYDHHAPIIRPPRPHLANTMPNDPITEDVPQSQAQKVD